MEKRPATCPSCLIRGRSGSVVVQRLWNTSHTPFCLLPSHYLRRETRREKGFGLRWEPDLALPSSRVFYCYRLHFRTSQSCNKELLGLALWSLEDLSFPSFLSLYFFPKCKILVLSVFEIKALSQSSHLGNNVYFYSWWTLVLTIPNLSSPYCPTVE